VAKEDGRTQGWRGTEEHKLSLLQQAAMKPLMLSQLKPLLQLNMEQSILEYVATELLFVVLGLFKTFRVPD